MASCPATDASGRESGKLVRVGTAGWSYRDWEGTVYPAPPPGRFDRLAWMARFVDVIEINASFYRAPARRDTASWVARTAFNSRFTFSAKLERVFTHESGRDDVAAERRFKNGLAPLAEADRLAALLVQYPYAFHNTRDNRARLSNTLTRFADYALAVEFRHRSWITAEVLTWLRARDVVLAGLDQPQIGASIGPSLPLTGPIFYLRLHGRNATHWFSPTAGREARYDHLYTPEELAPWLDRIRRAAASGVDGLVIANNHTRGQAAVNVVELRHALEATQVPAPASLVRAYPRLAARARLIAPDEADRRLF
ncbi:MAG: DUF72 domain-containing protein [Acidobacteriota bacterium]